MTTRAGPQLEVEYRRRFNSGYAARSTARLGYLDNSLQGTIYSQGPVQPERHLALGLRHRPRLVGGLRARLPPRRTPRQRPELADQPGLRRRASARAPIRASTSGSTRALNSVIVKRQAAAGPAALPVQLFRPARFARRPPQRRRRGVQRAAHRRHQHAARAASRSNWSRPFVGALGDLWKVTLHGDATGYNANAASTSSRTSAPMSQVDAARALPQAALDFRWPFMRDSGAWGTQLIEPIAQIVVGAAGRRQPGSTSIPNEDSLDLEFTDANLFGFNRFPGDRPAGRRRARECRPARRLVPWRHHLRRR